MPVVTLGTHTTPLGDVLLATGADGALRGMDFVECEDRLRRLLDLRQRGAELVRGRAPPAITQKLDTYFAGDLAVLRDIPVGRIGTEFQEMVWAALRQIEPGRPTTYSALARLLDRPLATRAVGHANATNPICVVVPCHRLIGANGALTGYSGGLERKRWLLDHEARHAGNATRSGKQA